MVNVLMVVLVVMVMVHRGSGICFIDQVPAAHAQVLPVSVCRQAGLPIAHETGWRVAERVGLRGKATPIRRHVEWVWSAASAGPADLESGIAASADPAH